MIWIHISKMEMVSFCLDTCFQNGNGSILFGYSFQLIWKLSLDLYPNQMETVSILEIHFHISWILVSIMDTSCGFFRISSSGLVTIGNTLCASTLHVVPIDDNLNDTVPDFFTDVIARDSYQIENDVHVPLDW